jgi:hypothetical protein
LPNKKLKRHRGRFRVGDYRFLQCG